MLDKEQMLKKYKRIFSIEYLVIATILLVIGFLKIFGILGYNPERVLVYNIITLIGVAYIIFDLVFNLASKKRRAKMCVIDKVFPCLLAIYLIAFDILVLAKIKDDELFIQYSIGAVLLYAGCFSTFLGIYHYFKPSQQIYDVVDEIYEAKLKELEEESKKEETSNQEENKDA